MQDFLNFVQKWFNAFSDIFRKLWHMLYNDDGTSKFFDEEAE